MTRTYDEDRGVVYVRSSKCETCIFTRNRPVSADRVKGMIADADAAGSCIPCHHHLYEGAAVEPVCRGYFERRSSLLLRLAVSLDMVEFTTD